MNYLNRTAARLLGSPRLSQPGPAMSKRAAMIRESNISEASQLAAEIPNVINLGQGLPEHAVNSQLKEAAKMAIDTDCNQYSDSRGVPALRVAIAEKTRNYNGIAADSDDEVTVTAGASEALNIALMAVVNPGDQVITFEPFYETYAACITMTGGIPRYVQLHAPDYTFDRAELSRAFNHRTRAILINNPHNPTGRVLSREELQTIAELCQKWNVIAITDEIYEYMIYDGGRHISLATIPGMSDRTITISGLSKTFGVTGWRLGYAVAPPDYSVAMRKVHVNWVRCAPVPMQMAGIVALGMGEQYYQGMVQDYQRRRDQISIVAANVGFNFRKPQGAYYLFTDSSSFNYENDRQLWQHLLTNFGIATVAGYCFYRTGVTTQNIRFCFAKLQSTIDAAAERLARFHQLELARTNRL